MPRAEISSAGNVIFSDLSSTLARRHLLSGAIIKATGHYSSPLSAPLSADEIDAHPYSTFIAYHPVRSWTCSILDVTGLDVVRHLNNGAIINTNYRTQLTLMDILHELQPNQPVLVYSAQYYGVAPDMEALRAPMEFTSLSREDAILHDGLGALITHGDAIYRPGIVAHSSFDDGFTAEYPSVVSLSPALNPNGYNELLEFDDEEEEQPVVCPNCEADHESPSHIRSCASCDCSICRDCANICSICDRLLCSGCTFDGEYCETCWESCQNDNISLVEFSRSPRILDYSATAAWEFHKQEWENTLYLGVELEIEFECDETEMFAIAKKYLANRHIWKYDGSLTCGGELVITPHTLQALSDINLSAMLKEFSSMGGTSYSNGNCGLHVHVGLDEAISTYGKYSDYRKLKLFFMQHREWIRLFAQRSFDSLNRYCRIPDHVESWCDRYVALNLTDNTLEFRIFRGTLDPLRFKASLEFTQAIIEFVKCHGVLHCGSSESLNSFIEWVRPRYHLLSKYIAKRFPAQGASQDAGEDREPVTAIPNGMDIIPF